MGIKFPFPHFLANTEVKVYTEGFNTDGDYGKEILYEGLAIYDEKSRQIMTAERQLVLLSGQVIIEGDIRPGKNIEGFVQIGEVKKVIHSTLRPRNPDGTVFSTELNLS